MISQLRGGARIERATMQGRSRNPSDAGRGYNNYTTGYRSSYTRTGGGGGSFGGRSSRPHLPPPPRRKEEILMEAGRLAAEYLVYKGLLPATSLPPPPKWQGGRYQGLKGEDGRTSALDRLGSLNSSDARRRYSEECNSRFRGKRRAGPYGREYSRENDSDWGRESGGRWMGRSRGYDDVEEEDDFAPGYRRDPQRGGFDRLPSMSENTGESASAEDTGSKASSSSARRDPPSEVDGGMSEPVADDDAKGASSEGGDEVKSDVSGDSKKKSQEEESNAPLPCETEGESKNGDDLVKFCGFAKVPTRPRSSVAQRSLKADLGGVTNEAGNTSEDTNTQASDKVANNSSVEPEVEPTDQQPEGSGNPPGLVSSEVAPDDQEDAYGKEGMKRQRESSPEDELLQVRAKKSCLEVEKAPVDEGKVLCLEIEEEQPLVDALIPKADPELDGKLEDEKQLSPASFKICDLNLMQGPEITEIPDDPDSEHLHSSGPRLTTGELSMDFGLSVGNDTNEAEFNRLQCNDKVVHVIDLEDDAAEDCGPSDPSRNKDEPIYPNLDGFLNQPEHADLPSIQDGYSLEISEYLGSDMTRCPSVPTDLNNLESGMGLHDAEGVPNDDDSIYVSLGEIPIGFMEVWDQPPQAYGKFF